MMLASVYTLVAISHALAVLYVLAVVAINIVCPLWLHRLQGLKKYVIQTLLKGFYFWFLCSNIHGPWDEAVLKAE